MRRVILPLLWAATFCLASCTRGHAPLPDHPGPVAPDFTLLDHEGRSQQLSREAGARAIVIIVQGNDCPIIQKYSATIRELAAHYSALGVPFFLLNANPQDTRATVIREAAEYNYGAPIMLDPSQAVARALGVTRTGEALIIDPRTWKIIFRGAIDDRLGYGVDKQEPKIRYLAAALDDLLAGRKIAQAPAPARGCAISFHDVAKISYSTGVATVLREKCLSCHSPGGFYPPFFDGYEKVKGWASMIRETILTERMPPWSSDPHFGSYSNDLSLTPTEKREVLAWIEAGAPRGEGKDPLVGAAPARSGRKLPPKLWEVKLAKPNRIEPRGTVEYQFFEVGGPAPYDMWVTAFRTASSNPQQLHHESMMITSHPLAYYQQKLEGVRSEKEVAEHPDGDLPLWTMELMKGEQGRDENYVRFGVWSAGRPQPTFFPAGTAIFIPKGYYAILEVHYVGNGKVDHELTTVEMFGQRARGSLKQMRTMQVMATALEVPAGERRVEFETKRHLVKRDLMVTGFLSHLHMRGRAVKMLIEEPTGEERVLASIPNFDFNWQSGFPLLLKKALRIPAGSKLRAVCEYDNSATNPLNPDPTRSVRHGQTLDRAEMCKFMVAYYYAD